MRRTKRAYSFVRNKQKVGLASFIEKDKATFNGIQNELVGIASKRFFTPATVFEANSPLKFSVKILENLRSEIPMTSRIHLTDGHNSWPKFEKGIHFLYLIQIVYKKEIIQQQLSSMAPQTVGVYVYDPGIIVRALDVLLSLDVDKEEFNVKSGHQCACCSYLSLMYGGPLLSC